MSRSHALLLIEYDVHPDVDRDEYEQWLRDVDNPFFNSQPGILRYENWKVLDARIGTLGHRYFDLVEVEGPDEGWEAFAAEAVQEFSNAWIARWSVAGPDAPLEANFRLLSCVRVAGPSDP